MKTPDLVAVLATLNVLIAGCAHPCPAQDLSGCVVGVTFADCGGSDWRAYCAERGSCLWISSGCPAGDHSIPFSTDCDYAGGPWPEGAQAFLYTYGPNEWTRTREMKLGVVIDQTVDPPAGAPLTCSSAAPCAAFADPGTLRRREFPGTFVERFRADRYKVVFAGTLLELEIDVTATPGVARACKQLFTDDMRGCKTAGDPVCADAGEVRLQARPTAANYELVKGTLSAHFPDGLVISGAL